MTSPARYLHTLKYLRPVQVYGRLWYRLARPRPDTSPAPSLREKTGSWVDPARREPSLRGPDTFVFLQVPGSLPDVGWDGPQREKLWRYNQHYFDDLNAEGANLRAAWHADLLTDWIAGNPPGKGSGWEPYPTSLRIVNWIKHALEGGQLPAACVHSLAVQARWLTRRLEWHLLGNHLFANAKALVFAGMFFTGPEADQWLTMGTAILRRQLGEQVLEDGGHFELSTMYHALATEDMLDLCNLVNAYRTYLRPRQEAEVAAWPRVTRSMLEWLATMCHPDGGISFFNDAALGIAPSPREIARYAARLAMDATDGAPSRWLQASGYARIAFPRAVLLLDAGRIGPDYLPGHAHADTLSFELSVDRDRLLVNSGTSCYGWSDERLRQRGTRAHNTVTVEGRDSSEVWGGFRVARRARVLHADVDLSGAAQVTAVGAHDGYMRLPGRPVHERRWHMTGNELVVEDRLTAHGNAEARFHFHPDARVTASDEARSGHAITAGGARVHWHVDAGEPAMEPSTWHPRFGASVPSTCLAVRLVAGRSVLRIQWS